MSAEKVLEQARRIGVAPAFERDQRGVVARRSSPPWSRAGIAVHDAAACPARTGTFAAGAAMRAVGTGLGDGGRVVMDGVAVVGVAMVGVALAEAGTPLASGFAAAERSTTVEIDRSGTTDSVLLLDPLLQLLDLRTQRTAVRCAVRPYRSSDRCCRCSSPRVRCSSARAVRLVLSRSRIRRRREGGARAMIGRRTSETRGNIC